MPHAHQGDECRSPLATRWLLRLPSVHDRCEVIADRGTIRQVNRYATANRQEGIETELGDCIRIMVAIPTGVLLNGRLNGGGHDPTVAAIKTYGQSPRSPRARSRKRQPKPKILGSGSARIALASPPFRRTMSSMTCPPGTSDRVLSEPDRNIRAGWWALSC
jgi:hypothetical protein